MSSFRKPVLVLLGLALLVSTGSLFAQQSELYNNWTAQTQTRNIPAGTVVDPGSSLLYIIDTGVNLRQAVGADLTGYNSPLSVVDQGENLTPNPFGIGGTQSIYNADGTLDADRINRNFIAITNAHPTAAVTVHFRYFNDECIDVLDFLVLLTCNDTLIFDPFNFNIPGTNFNTRTRIFGPAQGLFVPIRAADFASGKFLIFATAAGTSYEPGNNGPMDTHDDIAEFRFPSEFDDFIDEEDHCDNLQDNTYFGLNDGLRADNLHVFNSSAVAFNYLIGNWTTAVPFSGVFQAWGLNAWTRPAVDLTLDDFDNVSLRGQPDGDGPPLVRDLAGGGNDFRILTGREDVRGANGVSLVAQNDLYLRNDVHGGDTANVNDIDGDGDDDFDSWYGALGNTSLFGAPPGFADGNSICFLSIVDDYNGSRHASDTPVGGFVDRSYNVNGAETVYVLQIYNWDEVLFDVEEDTPINISPPPFEAPTAILKITVKCLRVWITDVPSPATSVDEITVTALGRIADGLVGFLTAGSGNPQVDASRGWIRFVRDNSINRSNGATDVYGTWVPFNTIHDTADEATFVTIATQTVRLSGFGAGWWLYAVPSLPLVSTTGDPQCNGACPNPTQP